MKMYSLKKAEVERSSHEVFTWQNQWVAAFTVFLIQFTWL